MTDQTVIKEGKTKQRSVDLKVGDHVWMKFERISDGDIAHLIVVKQAEKQE